MYVWSHPWKILWFSFPDCPNVYSSSSGLLPRVIGPPTPLLLCIPSEPSQVLEKRCFEVLKQEHRGLKRTEHIELDSDKPLQQLRVLRKFTASVLPLPHLRRYEWYGLPMVSLYALWLTTQTVLWGGEQACSLIIH